MALPSLSELDQFRAAPCLDAYPERIRTLYAPVDKVHEALRALIGAAQHSLAIAMFGYDDLELDAIVRQKLESERVFVQMSLDKSQSGAKTEQEILAQWQNDGIGNSIAIGHSEKGSIVHLKMAIIDGLDVITGSTNWSQSGETRQDNALVILRDAVVAAEARTRLDLLHDALLKQMAKGAPHA